MKFEQMFIQCENSEDVKKLYRELCKQWHPDLGEPSQVAERTKLMQDINALYARYSALNRRREEGTKARAHARPEPDEAFYADAAAVDECVRAAIERIITLEGLEIEICGLWVWVGGQTYTHRAALKAAEYTYSGHKRMWYFAGVPAQSRQSTSIENIRARYGSMKVKGHSQDQQDSGKEQHVSRQFPAA